MKKIIILIVAIFFGAQLKSFPQNMEKIRIKLDETSRSNKYLKDFNFKLKPNEDVNYTVVLSKNTIYNWYTYIHIPNQLQIILYDDQKNILFQNKTNNNGIINFTTKCIKSGVYNLHIQNTSNESLKSIVLLTFAGRTGSRFSDNIVESQDSTLKKQRYESQCHKVKNKDYYLNVNEMPKFKGQNSIEFKKFLSKEIKYPQEAIDKIIQGNVFVQFVIDKYGYIKDAKVVSGVHPSLDQEALRIVYSSPRWEPGIHEGKPVDVLRSFPIRFKLN